MRQPARIATVVIVTWNGAHLLPSCLDGLRRQSIGLDSFRTVVVDNASVDSTPDVLTRYPGVDVIRSPRNLGFAGGATLGLRAVDTPFAVVLNNDAIPEAEWLERLLAGFEPGVVAVTSKILLLPRFVRLRVGGETHHREAELISAVQVDDFDVSGSTLLVRSQFGVELLVPVADGTTATVTARGPSGPLGLSIAHEGTEAATAALVVAASVPRVDVINSAGGMITATAHGADRGYLEVDNGQYSRDQDVFSVCGAAAAFRTAVGHSQGWFDPWYFAYYEDVDLSWRLRRAGFRVRYVAAAVVRHQHAASSRVGSDLFLFHNYRNRLATVARNATATELVGFVRASVGREHDHAASVVALGHIDPSVNPVRHWLLRIRATAAFAAHLPRILGARIGRRVPSSRTC